MVCPVRAGSLPRLDDETLFTFALIEQRFSAQTTTSPSRAQRRRREHGSGGGRRRAARGAGEHRRVRLRRTTTCSEGAGAERKGFEPLVPLRVRLISNQVPSAARSSLRGG